MPMDPKIYETYLLNEMKWMIYSSSLSFIFSSVCFLPFFVGNDTLLFPFFSLFLDIWYIRTQRMLSHLEKNFIEHDLASFLFPFTIVVLLAASKCVTNNLSGCRKVCGFYWMFTSSFVAQNRSNAKYRKNFNTCATCQRSLFCDTNKCKSMASNRKFHSEGNAWHCSVGNEITRTILWCFSFGHSLSSQKTKSLDA